MADKVFAAERTRQAIEAADEGRLGDARVLLAEALTQDPAYSLAWQWFAAVTEDEGEQKYCLEKVRELDADHRTSPALAHLRERTSVAPPELVPITDPPPPELITGFAEQARSARRRRVLLRSIAVLAVLAVAIAIVAVVANSRVRYAYIALVVEDEQAGELNGQEQIKAAEWAVDAWNRTRASSDRQLRLVTFTDGGDPARAAQVAEQIVADGRFVGVIGHSTSATSLAAAPVYAAAGIPAITATATADSLTADNQWYFRTVFDNSEQGRGMAIYAAEVLGNEVAVSVSSDDPYGQTLRTSFVEAFKKLGTVAADIVLPADPARMQAELPAVAATIDALPKAGVVALSTTNTDASALAGELAKRGAEVRIIAPDALDTDEFFTGLSRASAAAVNRSYAATPLTEGTLTGAAVTFYDNFSEAIGFSPSWAAGMTYDAVDAFAEAMERGEATWNEGEVAEDRQRIRDALDSARSPETSFQTLTGPLWFDADNAASRPVAFEDGRVSSAGIVTVNSAAYQLQPYSPTAGVSLDDEIAAGTAVIALGDTFTLQRVIRTGFNINQVEDLNAAAQTFKADFFLWFKYRGSKSGPSDVQFVNAMDPGLALGPPQRVSSVDGENYELYRVSGTFRAQLEFSAFPFDTQNLPITLQNSSLTAARITYVPDPDNLDQSQDERLQSGVDAATTIDQIPNWEADEVQFYPTSVGNTGALGDPSLEAGTQGITYSQMVAETTISRDVTSFLIKNMLPLLLLTIVTYVSLWYPYKDATSRISFGVTGILTGAVMLNSVTSSLPSVDYTVAIAWAYYAFILLSGLTILGTLIGRRYTDERQLAKARVLDRIMRIGYPAFVVGVALTYAIAF